MFIRHKNETNQKQIGYLMSLFQVFICDQHHFFIENKSVLSQASPFERDFKAANRMLEALHFRYQ
jgi:hypothetical protein